MDQEVKKVKERNRFSYDQSDFNKLLQKKELNSIKFYLI